MGRRLEKQEQCIRRIARLKGREAPERREGEKQGEKQGEKRRARFLSIKALARLTRTT